MTKTLQAIRRERPSPCDAETFGAFEDLIADFDCALEQRIPSISTCREGD